MGQARLRCKDKEKRVQLAIERIKLEAEAKKETERLKLLSMTDEERELLRIKNVKLKRAKSLLATALILGNIN